MIICFIVGRQHCSGFFCFQDFVRSMTKNIKKNILFLLVFGLDQFSLLLNFIQILSLILITALGELNTRRKGLQSVSISCDYRIRIRLQCGYSTNCISLNLQYRHHMAKPIRPYLKSRKLVLFGIEFRSAHKHIY